ncbi:MAG: T9SS type A sorting domain-containing protein [Ignavibacteria bacterium]|nr:T9SS type A sorting domain-containing protein [Ignavibacteria bacterium]
MRTPKHHRINSIFAVAIAVAFLQLIAFHVVKADKPNNPVTRTVNVKGETALRYTGTAGGAMEVAVTALAKRTAVKSAAKTQISADTAKRESRILFARVASDVFNARVELVNDENQTEIGIYNMLGKKMMDVHKGGLSRGQHDFALNVPELPDGVYICIMQGSDFRRAEKFYLSR